MAAAAFAVAPLAAAALAAAPFAIAASAAAPWAAAVFAAAAVGVAAARGRGNSTALKLVASCSTHRLREATAEGTRIMAAM